MSAKKSFRNSPAMQFLSVSDNEDTTQNTAEPTPAPAEISKTPTPAEEPTPVYTPQSTVPMKRNPEYIETRSKRVQLLMQPSLHDGLRKLAQQKDMSLNDLVHHVMQEYLKHQKK